MTTLPPRDLAARVLGVPSDERTYELYDRSGRATRDAIIAMLPADFSFAGKRVLDFGCGAGRTLRHFAAQAEDGEFWGCDSHAASVAWCEQHLPMRFLQNPPDPPLPFEDGHFDLIYAVAVYTHLVLNWSQWLAELHRLLAPGGLLVATFHSKGLWDRGFAASRGMAWAEDATGMHVEYYGATLQDSCGSAVWLSEWWVREHWGRAFEILALRQTGFAPDGADGDRGQGVAAMRRREVALTPQELQRPSEDPREAIAAQRSRDLLLVELRETAARAQPSEPAPAPPAPVPSAPRPAIAAASRFLPKPVQNLRHRLSTMASAIGETRAHVLENRARVEASRTELLAELAAQRAELGQLRSEGAELAGWLRSLARWEDDRARVLEILRLIYYDEPRLRAQLHEIRRGASYPLAYEEPEPLVSVVMRTYDNYRLLQERSIPSVLEQSYQNFEIIVIGDKAPAGAEEAVLSFGDERISYENLNRRGPYPTDPRALWYVAGVPPYNEAMRRARGHWIAPLDDDDAFRPHHIEALLELAIRDRLELAYGKLMHHRADAQPVVLGRFPPINGEFGFQGALFHEGLRFFELELAEALFLIPDDWGGTERMLRTGVRMGMLDDVVTDYFPASEFTPRSYMRPAGDG